VEVVHGLIARLWHSSEARWLVLYVILRLSACSMAVALELWAGLTSHKVVMLLYGPLSTIVLAASPKLRQSRAAWAFDYLVTLGLIVESGDWRSPYYMLWLAALALPAAYLPLRSAIWLGLGAPVSFLLVAILGRPSPGSLGVFSTETLAIHLWLPILLVGAIAYVRETLRRLGDERSERERLAIEAERRRIAWELHDSAKQRLHAAHLLVSSLSGRVEEPLAKTVARAAVELESAASDMDASLAELRSPLEGARLHDALRKRAEELSPDGHPHISVVGDAPHLPPLIAAHVYRIGSEAITNALRHADASKIDVRIAQEDGALWLQISDDGRGFPDERRPGANGLFAMESRAATLGAQLELESGAGGTTIELRVPLDQNGVST